MISSWNWSFILELGMDFLCLCKVIDCAPKYVSLFFYFQSFKLLAFSELLIVFSQHLIFFFEYLPAFFISSFVFQFSFHCNKSAKIVKQLWYKEVSLCQLKFSIMLIIFLQDFLQYLQDKIIWFAWLLQHRNGQSLKLVFWEICCLDLCVCFFFFLISLVFYILLIHFTLPLLDSEKGIFQIFQWSCLE